MPEITYSYVKSLLSYDPEAGVIYWKKDKGRKSKKGSVAGYVDSGYLRVYIDGKSYRAHRIAWLLSYECWPSGEIDHINGNRSDNRIANLRECSRNENMQNLPVLSQNKSGYMGVSWNAQKGKWRAETRNNNKKHFLGYFNDPDDAHKAYLCAKSRLHQFNPVPRLDLRSQESLMCAEVAQ